MKRPTHNPKDEKTMTVANSQAWHVLPISKREDGYFLPVRRTKPATWQKANRWGLLVATIGAVNIIGFLQKKERKTDRHEIWLQHKIKGKSLRAVRAYEQVRSFTRRK